MNVGVMKDYKLRTPEAAKKPACSPKKKKLWSLFLRRSLFCLEAPFATLALASGQPREQTRRK
jgi:hypothetical protein